MTDNRARTICFVVAFCLLLGCTFMAGVAFSRNQIRSAAEELASQPVNSFTMCLTEAWAESAELSPEWKGRRKWVLQEEHP